MKTTEHSIRVILRLFCKKNHANFFPRPSNKTMPKRKIDNVNDALSAKRRNSKKECPECHNLYENLKQHLANVHGIGEKRYFPCPVCGKEFNQSSNMKTHLAIHGKPKFTCPKCGKECKQKAHLKTHLASVHNVGTSCFKCGECGKEFKQKSNLKTHTSMVHRTAPVERCLQCGKTFIGKRRLKNHVKNIHDTNPEHVCEKCGKKCKRKWDLKMHLMAAHDVDVVFQECSFCETRFKTKGALKKHEANIHGINTLCFVCPECDQGFKQKSHLKKHLTHCHDIGEFECRFCCHRVAKLTPFKDVNSQISHICRKCFRKMTGHQSRAEEEMVQILKKEFGPYFLFANRVLKGEKCQTRRRPDAYLTFPHLELHLFVECDERQHQRQNYTFMCEKGRMHELCDEVPEGHKIFVRWNPDRFRFDSSNHKLPRPRKRQDRLKSLIDYIRKIIATFDVEKAGIPEVHYLFYDFNNPLIVPANSEEFTSVFV